MHEFRTQRLFTLGVPSRRFEGPPADVEAIGKDCRRCQSTVGFTSALVDSKYTKRHSAAQEKTPSFSGNLHLFFTHLACAPESASILPQARIEEPHLLKIAAGDSDGDGLQSVFTESRPLPGPYRECGTDGTSDPLTWPCTGAH